jgi:hypothetical protein
LTAQNGDVWLGALAAWRSFETAECAAGRKALKTERALPGSKWAKERSGAGGSDRILEFNGKTWSTVRAGFDRVNRMTKTHEGKVWSCHESGLHASPMGPGCPTA